MQFLRTKSYETSAVTVNQHHNLAKETGPCYGSRRRINSVPENLHLEAELSKLFIKKRNLRKMIQVFTSRR